MSSRELCYFCPDPREQDQMSINLHGRYKRVYATCELVTGHDRHPACDFHAAYYIKRGTFAGVIPQTKEEAEKFLRAAGRL